ncbi:MAG TPA: DedA family protein [Candidatus Sulfotelmatobacter sp.]|nr:DedA family protein [Candidatus Sulfotelmatobacter sp.]
MSFLTGLHGALASMLICALLLVDEAGIPLPFAPNEVLLVVAGLLIATGAVSPAIFVPVACVAMIAGTLLGYSWARAVGSDQLRSLAGKVRASRAYDRASRRMAAAGPVGIGVTRLIPGVRPYATLIAGAARVPLSTFLKGAIPAIMLWCGLFTFLGFVVGVPAVHLLSQVERLGLSGALFLGLGFWSYRSARHAPTGRPTPGPFARVPSAERLLLALAIDAGVIATIGAGFDSLTRSVLHLHIPHGRADIAVILAAITLGYVIISRRARVGETAGEHVFGVTYVHLHRSSKRRRGTGTRPPRRLWKPRQHRHTLDVVGLGKHVDDVEAGDPVRT